jgi:hypothetical protein
MALPSLRALDTLTAAANMQPVHLHHSGLQVHAVYRKRS